VLAIRVRHFQRKHAGCGGVNFRQMNLRMINLFIEYSRAVWVGHWGVWDKGACMCKAVCMGVHIFIERGANGV
jgi:hypothetical protein